MISLKDCGLFRDLYNKIYLYTKEKEINRQIQDSEGAWSLSVQKTIEDFALSCLEDFNLSSSKKIREIKVKIIKQYYKEKEVEVGHVEVKSLINIAKEKIHLQMCLNLVDTQIISLTNDDELDNKKRSYLNEISNDPEERKLVNFLSDVRFIKLARKIDKDMNKNLTMRDLAKLILFDYEPAIRRMLTEDGLEAGADNITKACLAVFLLQKNTKFSDAIAQIFAFCQKEARVPYLVTAAIHHQSAIETIKR